MSELPVIDEKPVEQALREILEALDRRLTRVTAFLPLGGVTVVPLVFFVFWLGLDWTGRRALILAGGAFCALIAIHLVWEIAVSRMARRRFDQRFPPGTPQRATALHILFEMESPSRAEDKLRVALADASPDRIVRRRSAVTSEPSIAWTPPANEEMAANPSVDHAHPPKAGGYYDYIPLEPRPSGEDYPGDRKV